MPPPCLPQLVAVPSAPSLPSCPPCAGTTAAGSCPRRQWRSSASVSKGVIGSASWPEPRHLHSHARHRPLTLPAAPSLPSCPPCAGTTARRFMPPPSVAKQRQREQGGDGFRLVARASASSFSCSPPGSHPPSAPSLGAVPALCGHGAAGSAATAVLAAERERNTGKNWLETVCTKIVPGFLQVISQR